MVESAIYLERRDYGLGQDFFDAVTGVNRPYGPSPALRPPALPLLPRQCVLIHVEQVWAENLFTAEGRFSTKRPTPGRMNTAPARASPAPKWRLG